jgi:hypothetical protein
VDVGSDRLSEAAQRVERVRLDQAEIAVAGYWLQRSAPFSPLRGAGYPGAGDEGRR